MSPPCFPCAASSTPQKNGEFARLLAEAFRETNTSMVTRD